MITLYDIPSRLIPMPWSLSTWRARFVLNYKKIPYKTEWLSYSDIKPTLQGFKGCVDEKEPQYTLPVIRIPATTENGEDQYVQDSFKIAKIIEALYPPSPPSSSLFTNEASQLEFQGLMFKAFIMPLVPLIAPHIFHILESDRAKEHFIKTIKDQMGLDVLEMYPKTREAEEKQWGEGIRGLDELAQWMDQRRGERSVANDASPWIFGEEEPTWADIVLVSAFLWVEKGGKEGAWDRIKPLNGGRWNRLYDGLKPYMQVL